MPSSNLTYAEREALQTLLDTCDDFEIACQRIGISECGLRKRLASAREKLSARSTCGAMVIAQKLGLISLSVAA
jgi:predicted DNA-binding protein (UPF0251 family)